MVNGTICYQIKTGGGTDTSGDPIPVSSSWSDPVECNIRTNTHNNKGTYQGGQFTVSAYEILLEATEFSAERVRITNNRDISLGEFQVQNTQFLDNVGRVKIIV